jgi:hypothetical protein
MSPKCKEFSGPVSRKANGKSVKVTGHQNKRSLGRNQYGALSVICFVKSVNYLHEIWNIRKSDHLNGFSSSCIATRLNSSSVRVKFNFLCRNPQ